MSVFVSVDNPAPALLSDAIAITPRPTGSMELVGDDLPVFHWKHGARFSYSCATRLNNH